MVLVLIGIGIGLAVALALARFVASLLYEVSPSDATTLAGVSALLTAAAAVACLVPARRAARVNPVEALRYE